MRERINRESGMVQMGLPELIQDYVFFGIKPGVVFTSECVRLALADHAANNCIVLSTPVGAYAINRILVSKSKDSALIIPKKDAVKGEKAIYVRGNMRPTAQQIKKRRAYLNTFIKLTEE